MARLFPFRSETPAQDGTPRVVDLEGDDADAVFGALSSTTARRIYARLDEEPGTPSDVAEAIDSSIQNVRYHLEKLEDAGLVEVVDTWYSSRGNEMSVYATTDGPLIVTSDESTGAQLKAAISRLIGAIAALAGMSLMVQYGLTRWIGTLGTGSSGVAPAPRDDAAPADGDAGGTTEEAPADDAGEPTDDAADEEPGVMDVDEPEEEADEPAADDSEEADAPEEEFEEAEDAPADEELEADDGGFEDADADAGDADVGDVPDADPTSGEPVADDGYGVGENVADGGAEAWDLVFDTVPPGLLFFLGGLVVLLAVGAYWYWYRPRY